MKTFILIVMFLAGFFVVAIVLNIAIGLFMFFRFRRCPYCGKRMKYQYTRRDSDGGIEAYVFHCPHCGSFENVTPLEMIREQHEE